MRNRKAILKAGASVGFICGTAFVVYAVFTSTSSTAAVGLLSIPLYGFAAASVGWTLVYITFALLDLRSGRSSWKSTNVLIATALLGVFLFAGLAVLEQRRVLSVAENPASSPQTLEEISQRWIPWGRRKVIIALAKNPSTPSAILDVMEASGDPSVVQLVGANPNTLIQTLERIAAGALTYDRVSGLAGNQKISRVIMEKLMAVSAKDFQYDAGAGYNLYQIFVLGALARNAALPQDLFDRLASRDSPPFFLAFAIINVPRATCAQISRFLDPKESWSQNPSSVQTIRSKLNERNCPAENS